MKIYNLHVFINLRPIGILLFSGLLSTGALAQLQINELMPKNVSYLMDESWNFSMWVELYNASAIDTIEISEYTFTDDPTIPEKWRPLEDRILPGAYTLLWFERDDRTGHASFKLSPEGGCLLVYDSGQNLVDRVDYPSSCRNCSFGRVNDQKTSWGFFDQPTPGQSNNSSSACSGQCDTPVFNCKGGFFTSPIEVYFTAPVDGSTIRFTIDNREPTNLSAICERGRSLRIDSTVVIRAKAFKEGKLSSNVATATFFINERKPALRVISLSTDQRFLTNDTIGIYCDGTNGILGNLQKTPKNFNQDWDRPANFELYDEAGQSVLNQEVDIKILGGGSRESALKSLSVSPKKKFGNNRLRYDLFASTKPGLKYKDIMLRNSGNDFKRTMMKDAFLQSIVMRRMDVDYQAYEPAVIYINGVYSGIENMRERNNKDFVYSNHGLNDDEITLIEATYKDVDSYNDMATDTSFANLSQFLKDFSMEDDANYGRACEMIDVNEYMNYLMPEIFVGNVDWPYNNVKMWKKNKEGKWRWILMDIEYSYGLGRLSHNSLTFALGENTKSLIGGYTEAPEWSTVVFAQLIKNENFRNHFIDRFAIHLSSTFKPGRVIHIMDSIAARIRDEIPYHKARYGHTDTFESDQEIFRTFSTQRPAILLGYIGERFLNSPETQTLSLKANTPGASYFLNEEAIIDPEIELNYYSNRHFSITANPIKGYRFSHWLANGKAIYVTHYQDILNAPLDLTAVYQYDDGSGLTNLKHSSEEIRAYPTLFDHQVFILNARGKPVSFTDMTGQCRQKFHCQTNEDCINTDLLPRGLYIVQIGNNTYKMIRR